MLDLKPDKKGKVLAFGAHPDDIEFGCGGTLKKLILAGWEVEWVVLTSGQAGHAVHLPDVLQKIREEEARAAAKQLGVREVYFLGLTDGALEVNLDVKLKVIQMIRRVRPEIVFTHASSDQFSDHQTAASLVQASLGAAKGPWFAQAGGAPWAVPAVYGYEVWDPLPEFQTAVDISETLEAKVAALMCHKSQIESIQYDLAATGLAGYRGAMSGVGSKAEVFQVLQIPFAHSRF